MKGTIDRIIQTLTAEQMRTAIWAIHDYCTVESRCADYACTDADADKDYLQAQEYRGARDAYRACLGTLEHYLAIESEDDGEAPGPEGPAVPDGDQDEDESDLEEGESGDSRTLAQHLIDRINGYRDRASSLPADRALIMEAHADGLREALALVREGVGQNVR